MEEASLSLVIIPSFTLDDSDLITKLSCLTDLTFRQLTSDSISERPDTVALFQGGLNQCNAIFRKYHTKRLQLIHNGVIFSIRCLGYSESSGPHADTLPTIASSKHIPRIRAENGIPRAKNVSILDLIDELGDDILNVTAVFKEFKSADDCISLWGAYSAIKAVLRIDFPMDYLLEGDLLAREGDSNVPRSLSATQKQDVGSGRKRAGARTKEPLKNPRTIQMTYVVFLKLFLKVKRMGLTSTANLNAARNFNLSVGGTPRGSEDISQADIGASLHDNISTSQDIMRRARVRVFQSDRAIHSVNELSHEEDTHSVCTVLDPTNASTSDAFLNCEDTISVPLTSVRMCVSDHTTGTLPLHRLSESGIVPFFSIPSPLPTSSESLEPVYWLTMAPFWEYVASVLERCGCHASNQRGNAAMSIELQGIFLEYDINRCEKKRG